MQYRLPNGLHVILQENRAAPVVALQAWVQVGSADETDREAGLAHLHEHMLFKGTRKRGPGVVAKDIESRGGEVNAWTSFDQTVYHLTIASRFFEDGLEILGDQVLGSIFDPEELAREVEVVIEEIKRSADSPSRRASRALFELAFREHTYGRPVIGFPHTVRSFTRDDVVGFYRRHYTPDNITLVVVGDFDAERARRAIEEVWSEASGRHGGHHPRKVEPEQTSMRARILREQVMETHLALAWPIPDILSEDLAPLDLAAAVLGHGDSSRLVQEVKRDKHLVNDIYSYAYTPKDPGLFVVGATLPHERTAPAVEEILRQVHRLREKGPSDKELSVAKHLLESEAIWQKETMQGVARKLGFYSTITGSLDFEERYYERLRSATAEEVRAACERWLRAARLNVVALGGEEGTITEEELGSLSSALESGDGHRAPRPQTPAAPPPAPAPARRQAKARGEPIGETGILKATLDSGAVVLVRPESAVPVVAVRAAFLGGLRYETEETNGVDHLLARVVTKGTRRHPPKELAARTDELAASIVGVSGRNSFGLRGDFLARTFEPSFRLFAECLLEPSFEQKEVDRERALQVEAIRSRDDNPSSVAFDLFSHTIFRRHPYRFDPLGTAETLAAFGPGELEGWLRRHYGPEGLVLSVVGDVEPEEAFSLAEELFGGATSERRAPPEVPVVPPVEEPRRAMRHMDKQQAHLVLGFPGARFQDPERYALEVLASVLAGQGGRLFYELRDKRSMAYSVTAFNLEGIDPGYFGVYMGTSPEKLADAEEGIRAELARVAREPISEEELLRARRYLVGSHAIGLQKNSARAATFALDERYGMGADNFARYAERIESVTREDVLEAARRTLDPRRSVLAVVTPR
ncbi:MAG TPA: pitrilysin family protein [Vulgatibacter sp.]|nr:pitrilysin family protein [Vulgatibacter sp.]